MGVAVCGELKQSVSSGKRALKHSSSTCQTSQWSLSDAPPDLTVEVQTAVFTVHKFPLISKSGKLKGMLEDGKDTKMTRIALHGMPGGQESFKLVNKFCHGLELKMSLSNVAMLHCAAHYLHMNEKISENNLQMCSEIFLEELIFSNVENSIVVLCNCEKLLPFVEEIGLVDRLIDAITSLTATKDVAVDVTTLSFDFFIRLMIAFKSKGMKQDASIKMLIDYTCNSPHGIPFKDIHVARGRMSDGETFKKKRVVVETIVGLLPDTQSSRSHVIVPLSFLSYLLKVAIMSSASPTCISTLERSIGMQLDKAILEDILIPANPNQFHQLYDTNSISRIFTMFLNMEEEEEEEEEREDGKKTSNEMERKEGRSPEEMRMVRVARLMDNYLGEIALDSNLMINKFIALAEMLPNHARLVDDGLYKAVDIFLKVHPNTSDVERKRLCKTIDCHKLSQETCSHAAQNDRLPVHMTVQVLYLEQLRFRNAINGGGPEQLQLQLQLPKRSSSGAVSPRDNYASVRRENRELKLEVARLRVRLTEIEKEQVVMKGELLRSKGLRKVCCWLVRRIRRLGKMFRWSERRKKKANCCSFHFPFARKRRESSTI